MNNDFILIYKSNTFAESKEAEFELRNTFKKYELHASYMTKRKFKVMAQADKSYHALTEIHKTLSPAAFVLFVHPTEECKHKTDHEINELIDLLKKETHIQNEDTYFVGIIKDGTCISQEQLQKLYKFHNEIKQESVQSIQNWMMYTNDSPISIMNYNLNHAVASITYKNTLLQQTNLQNKLTINYIQF